jgi:hypothetical protein
MLAYKGSVRPSEVFAVLLRQLHDRQLKVGDMQNLHKTFYDLAGKNPHFMGSFVFSEGNPHHCITLQALIRQFEMAGVLCWFSMGIIKVDQERLNKFLPPDIHAYAEFDGIDALAKL